MFRRLTRLSALLLILAAFSLPLLATGCASQPTWDDPRGARAPADEPVEPGVEVDPDPEDDEEPGRLR